MKLVCDLLDSQIIDSENYRVGRCDGLVLKLRPGLPPRLTMIECGPAVTSRRLHIHLDRFLSWLERTLGVAAGKPLRIPLEHVKWIGRDVLLGSAVAPDEAAPWEAWLCEHVISHIPGSGE